ncbi:MAG: prolyl oligopeptidase family serine peptidase [Bacteroidales bacterium]
MRRFTLITTAIFLCITTGLFSQNEKKPLSISDLIEWKEIDDEIISNDGEWVSYEVKPFKGDGVLHLWNPEINAEKTFDRGVNPGFAANSDYLVFKIEPYTDSIKEKKLDDVPEKKLPKDSLGIYVFDSGELIKQERIKSFKLPEKESGWMVYHHEKEEDDDSEDNKENNNEKADDSAPEGTKLTVFHPVKEKTYEFDQVTDYEISEKGDLISFVQLQNDKILKSSVVVFDPRKEESDIIFSEEGLSKDISIDHDGEQLAFIHSMDTTETKVFNLYYWSKRKDQPNKLVDTLTQEIPEKWTVGEYGNIYFSDNDERLYFGTKERELEEPEDTLIEEEKVELDVWNWKDSLLQPQQLRQKEREERRTYLAVYHIDEDKIVQLADEQVRNVEPVLKGNGDVAIGTNGQPYLKQTSWNSPSYKDVYLVDINTGKKELVKEKIQSYIDISTGGNYFYWYSFADSNWYSYGITDKEEINLTKDIEFPLYDEDHDRPRDPSSYGFAGWTEDDEYLLIYDRYDIWRVDPSGKEKPINITNGYGRDHHIQFRYRELDSEQEFINPEEDLFLRAFDEDTKASGYFTADLKGKGNPQKLVMGDYSYYTPEKALETDKVIWQKASFKQFPDIWYSDLQFNDPKRVSEANPQQEEYLWGDVELVEWITTEGTTEEGLLYTPENYDPDKKYPMVVYFYRLSSDGMHRHRLPRPSRSTINVSFYVSNGYVVFMPNIRYKMGYPGESAYNYVVGGTNALLNKKDFIDKDRIGIQGQSWGGYQIAHIITKTDMYAAASAGAPVSNMTSAYGGIRWGTGKSRMHQYEKTQSRIGGTLWEKPLHYIENSPLFYAPKVNTPLLMRHNDADGAVPWYQGIEFFVALRRLDKPVWMLNYNDAPHNERADSPNRKDFSIRMKQFFDHYLKNDPAPVWMEKGIPATKKGKTRGYELVE